MARFPISRLLRGRATVLVASFWALSGAAGEKDPLTEEEIIEHFIRNRSATDSFPGEAAWESGRILNRNSEVVLPVLEKEFRENLDKPLYLASIVGFFQSKWNKGDKTILLDDLRAHIPLLEGNEEDWPLVRAGLVFLGNYGDGRDMLLVDRFADHEHGLIREGASLARKAFEKRNPALVVAGVNTEDAAKDVRDHDATNKISKLENSGSRSALWLVAVILLAGVGVGGFMAYRRYRAAA